MRLEDYFLPSVLTIYAAVIPCAILLPRVYPLNRQKDEYVDGAAEIKEEIPTGLGKMQWAVRCAVEKADGMTFKKFMVKGVQTVGSVWFDVLPMVMFVAATGMIVNEYTPIFQILTAPFVPILNLMGFAEATVARAHAAHRLPGPVPPRGHGGGHHRHRHPASSCSAWPSPKSSTCPKSAS